MTTIQLRDLRKSFGAFDVIKGIDMDIRSGEFMVLSALQAVASPRCYASYAGWRKSPAARSPSTARQ